MALLVNIDVPDLGAAEAFHVAAFGVSVGRRFDGFVELVGFAAPIYLLEKAAVTPSVAFSMLADPLGHGFCLIDLNARGYDALSHTERP